MVAAETFLRFGFQHFLFHLLDGGIIGRADGALEKAEVVRNVGD